MGLDYVLSFVRRAAPPSGGPDDSELLERFAASGDGAAFAELLRRHGPMVLALCRRLLGHLQDAEDAFQATFLVLASRPGAVRAAGSLAAWLHRVAQRAALRARAARSRRLRAEALPGKLPHPAVAPGEPADWSALYEELDRLPERYRAALALCYL